MRRVKQAGTLGASTVLLFFFWMILRPSGMASQGSPITQVFLVIWTEQDTAHVSGMMASVEEARETPVGPRPLHRTARLHLYFMKVRGATWQFHGAPSPQAAVSTGSRLFQGKGWGAHRLMNGERMVMSKS